MAERERTVILLSLSLSLSLSGTSFYWFNASLKSCRAFLPLDETKSLLSHKIAHSDGSFVTLSLSYIHSSLLSRDVTFFTVRDVVVASDLWDQVIHLCSNFISILSVCRFENYCLILNRKKALGRKVVLMFRLKQLNHFFWVLCTPSEKLSVALPLLLVDCFDS